MTLSLAMMLSFRAAALSGPGERLRAEMMEAEAPRAWEVLERIAAAGLCHTDLEVIERGADCVLAAVGNEASFRLPTEVYRVGGEIVWLGKVGMNQDVAYRSGAFVGQKRIIWSNYGWAQTQAIRSVNVFGGPV
jgi:Zn-dependent alcohol dehydrogenase